MANTNTIELVDEATLYDTTGADTVVIAQAAKVQGGRLLRDPELYDRFLLMRELDIEATTAAGLYPAAVGVDGRLPLPELPGMLAAPRQASPKAGGRARLGTTM